MSSLDDLPLTTTEGEPATAPPSAPPSRPMVGVIAGLVVVALAAGGWFVFRSSRPVTPVATTTPAAAVPSTAVDDPAPPAAPLPPLTEMDPFVRTLFAALSGNPELLKWLATDDLVGSIVTAIDRLSRGDTPSRDLAALRPATGFDVQRRGDATRTAPAAYARYAPMAAAVASVDPAALATAFHTLRPRLVESWVAHGHAASTFDDAVTKAVGVVATTPDVPADVALVPGTGGYAYADPALEGLPAAQKHLLRMGPANVALVREAARRFAAALDAPAR